MIWFRGYVMREKWARRIAYLTGILVLLLAVYFAQTQNPLTVAVITENRLLNQTTAQSELDQAESDEIMQERIEYGLKIYNQQGCSLCHEIDGHGNPRYPLDDVGSRRTAKELRDWVIGGDDIQGQLSERSFKFKQTHRNLTEYDLESLIYYLQSLPAI